MELEPPSLRRNVDQTREIRRSVKFSAVPSSAIMKALMSKMASSKIKTQRRASRMTERSFPKLIFDYGPITYRGLMMHRKIKIAPFAEHFQKKYPLLRVYYHPINDYNVVCVRLKDCIVQRMLLSNVTYSATEDITKNPFCKLIDQAIQRMMMYPNLLKRPFRDAVCLMTHNLDIDYDVPWYRTEFPRSVHVEEEWQPPTDQEYVVAACMVESEGPKPGSIHWKRFLETIEDSPEFEDMLEPEFCDPQELKTWKHHD